MSSRSFRIPLVLSRSLSSSQLKKRRALPLAQRPPDCFHRFLNVRDDFLLHARMGPALLPKIVYIYRTGTPG